MIAAQNGSWQSGGSSVAFPCFSLTAVWHCHGGVVAKFMIIQGTDVVVDTPMAVPWQ